MRYSARTLNGLRTGVVAVFVVGMLAIFGVLYVKFGGSIPGVTGKGYKLTAQFQNVQNLVSDSDVEMAGVPVGKVLSVSRAAGHVDVLMNLTKNVPLHDGVTVQIRPKTLLNETYVQITDGNGAAMPSHSTVGLASVRNQTTLNDILNTFNGPTRQATGQLITELQQATASQGDNLNQIFGALGDVGRNGQTVFDILANQSSDLQQLVKQTATLVGVLDEGQGQIGQLVTSAQQVNQTTANAQAAVAATIESLPGLMQSIHGAAGSVTQLSTTLQPIATNLQSSAGDLNYDLVNLPPLTSQLDALQPTLNSSLVEAPATLGPVQTTATQVDQLLPSLAYTLSDLDPMVAYLAPYNRDIAAFASNFGAAVAHCDTGPGTCGPGKEPTAALAEPLINANTLQTPTAQQTLAPGLSANANPLPGTSNGTGQSPAPAPPNYTRVQRLKY
ncbi:MlaD family protein [Acidiferrimicrobium sp. IK]|uniref:MlaD family protein n=1 Tax=Acidiferrimicrobium sp. IK TaxID=2871700 RepID=UPI0021CB0E5C|nr:MlaD family protein [Acidiferrimicrobium sp. IK]MCU4184408.1 MlaD family protein [Acidiferrimicrobium sp. IK]